jgi:hypothetical protein
MKTLILFLFCLPTGFSAFAQNHRIYVQANATGANTGASWADAFTGLQSACHTAIAGDTVWIAEGVYFPDTSGNRLVSFEPSSGVQLFGGFNGLETELSQRDWAAHTTVLSGDIGVAGDSTDNSLNVVYLFQPDSNTVLDGLIIRDGLANDFNSAYTSLDRAICGGGLYIMGDGSFAYPEIRNCTFEHNTAAQVGGGAAISGSNGGSVAPKWRHCVFNANHSLHNGGGLFRYGAALTERGVDLDGCIFTNNRADVKGGGLSSGDAPGKDSFNIVNCTFSHNYAGIAGGGIYFTLGRLAKNYCSLYNTNFFSNRSGQAAAVDFFTDNGTFQGAINIEKCTFKYNKGTQLIGGVSVNGPGIVYCDMPFSPNASFLIKGDLFEEDTTDNILIILAFSGNILMDSCIFRNNATNGILGTEETSGLTIQNSRFSGTDPYLNFRFANTPSAVFRNCLVETLAPDCSLQFDFLNVKTGFFENCTIINRIPNSDYLTMLGNAPKELFVRNTYIDTIQGGGPFFLYGTQCTTHLANCRLNGFDCANQFSNVFCEGDITTGGDPLFIDRVNHDYRLQPCSALVGAGSNAFVSASNVIDLNGAPRIQGGIVDIGAYETPAPNLTGAPIVNPACHGVANGSIGIQAQNGCGPYQTTWNSDTASGTQLANLQAGLYTLTITDARGSSFTTTVNIPEGSSLSLLPQGIPVMCGDSTGGSATAVVSGGPAPYTYQWQGSTDPVFHNLAPGDYPLTVTDALGCTATGAVSVTKTGNLKVGIHPMPISCHGDADGALTVTPLNGKPPYQWNWLNGPTGPTYAGLGPGTYNGTLTDAFGCKIVWEVPLTQPDSLYFEAIITPATDTMPGNGSIQLNPITGGTQPYFAHWSNGNPFLVAHKLKPGSYSVTLTDHNGCTKSATYTVPFTVGTNELQDAPVIEIYPNPADQNVHIRAEQAAGQFQVVVFNSLGQRILQTDYTEPDLTLRLAQWPPGIYGVYLWAEGMRSYAGKLIVQH